MIARGILLGAMSILLLGSCASNAEILSVPDNVVVLPSAEAMKALSVCSRPAPEGVVRVRQAAEEEVLEAEARLAGFLRRKAPPEITEHLHLYRRQYVGVLLEGRRALYVNSFLGERLNATDWRTYFVEVCGGGVRAWGVVYDLERGKFEQFQVNAPM